MPELPEVETVRRGLQPYLEGRRILRAIARRPDLRFPLPPDLGQRLTNRVITSVDRRAKYLLFRLDDGWVMIGHLGMSGRMCVFEGPPPPVERHDHVILEAEGHVTIRFNDPRRFGFLLLTTSEDLDAHPMLAGLGPEPIDASFDGTLLAGLLAGRRTPIKTALLDQRTVAGLGNIYVSEALYRAGISPRRSAATIKGRRADRLAYAIRMVIADAIAAGGSSLRDHRRPDGELGYFQHSFKVYGREGEPCPGCDCGKVIRRLVQGGRSTFYCPARQR